ncbi:MAG: nitroreductase family protein [Sedimentisphaerales bacterium]|nr:nitroreductase family protein [Sedimentisphaerales bacterium]
MDLYQAIRDRYSCRSFAAIKIETEKINRILEAARLAPSAKNLQDWRFVVVTDDFKREQIAIAANEQMFIASAPVIIVGCSNTDYSMRCGQKIGPIDVAIAMEHMALAATAEDLATCWVGSFYAEKVRRILEIPQKIEIIEIMPIGYPAEDKIQRPREDIESIVCYDKWQF